MFKEWICITRLDGKSEYLFASEDGECAFVTCPEANYCRYICSQMLDLPYEIFDWISQAKEIEWIDDGENEIQYLFDSMIEQAENEEQEQAITDLFAPFFEE